MAAAPPAPPVAGRRPPARGRSRSCAASGPAFGTVTERRQLEREVIQSGKLATLGKLAAGVAHELENPLVAILLLVDGLLKESHRGTGRHDRLLLIRETGLHLKGIVGSLLEFTREPADLVTTVALEDVADQAIELVRLTSGRPEVEVVAAYPWRPSVVTGNPSQLKQIFLNLLTNAHHAIREDGTVTVEVGRAGATAFAMVSDDGPGIPATVLPYIFEPFYTRRRDRGGTGLGLTVSREIARLHGGRLTARSEPGQGAVFVLELPWAGTHCPRDPRAHRAPGLALERLPRR
jgi:two-component system NtrC family sensor kinase